MIVRRGHAAVRRPERDCAWLDFAPGGIRAGCAIAVNRASAPVERESDGPWDGRPASESREHTTS